MRRMPGNPEDTTIGIGSVELVSLALEAIGSVLTGISERR
jgi:hypothetical protein